MSKFIIIAILIIALYFYFKVRKIPKLGNMILLTGGIKTGKSTLSVYLAYRKYKQQRFKYHVKKALLKVFKMLKVKKFLNKPYPEEPLLYSNVPLKIPYVPITHSLLNRTERFNYGSVVYLCEMSLIADSMSYKDGTLNEQLLLFSKLFAHETHGGYVIIDTQSINDNHYAIKRCLSTYLYIHHTIKTLPFVLLMWVKELHYSEDGNIVNINENDAEEDLKLVIVPKKIWKKFDCYCYSAFTDNLPIVNNVSKNPKTLKAKNIVSFKKYKTIKTKEVIQNENRKEN